jgi:hypothetical protein
MSDPVPRVHPNGFIQLDLSPDHRRRLHIWHPDVPDQGVQSIHDHVFDMESQVILGLLGQRLYEMHPDGDPHDLYRVTYHGGFEASLEPGHVGVPLLLSRSDRIGMGQVYRQSAFTFHVTVPISRILVTVMQRQHVYDGFSTVALPAGTVPQPFERATAMHVDDMWRIINAVVPGWRSLMVGQITL